MSNPDLLIYALHAGFRGAFGLAIAPGTAASTDAAPASRP